MLRVFHRVSKAYTAITIGASMMPMEDTWHAAILAKIIRNREYPTCSFNMISNPRYIRNGRITDARTAFPCQMRTSWKFPAV